MADSHEVPDDEAGNEAARVTFRWTMITAAGFVAAVLVFVLLR